MYLLFGIFLFLCILFFPFNYCRKKKIIHRICAMNTCEKIEKLNEILEPFGFSYESSQEIITSRQDAWQRQFGYCSLYDKTAPKFGMVFHCEPIYFSYQERTWMIEFWKGQYGINLGCEVGIYCSDTILSPEQYEHTLFHSVPDSQMLPISLSLYHKGSLLFHTSHKHWWLTGKPFHVYFYYLSKFKNASGILRRTAPYRLRNMQFNHLRFNSYLYVFPDAHQAALCLQMFLSAIRTVEKPDFLQTLSMDYQIFLLHVR